MTCGDCGGTWTPPVECDCHTAAAMCSRCGTVYPRGDHRGPGYSVLCLPCVDAICDANEAERAKVTP